MKKVIIGLIALLFAGSASAFEFEGSIGGVSNYVWRGATQTAGNPAIQGSIGIEHGGLYANAWGSQVDYNDDTDAEVDLTVGKNIKDFDVGYTYTWSEEDVEDSTHSVGIFYTF